MCDCNVERFLEQRSKSLAAKLMCPANINATVLYGKDKYCYCSIAFNAFCDGHLDILDKLLEEFHIEERGTVDFKNRLKENWLEEVQADNEEGIRKSSSNVMSALSELVVAKNLKNRGYDIVDLAAWKDGERVKPDVKCSRINEELNVEVKYLGVPPQVQSYINEQIRSGKGGGMSRDEHEFANFFFIRIAEAAIQLRHYDRNSREVWLVFSPISVDRGIFENNYLRNSSDWFEDALSIFDKLEFKRGEKTEIRSKRPSEWLHEANKLVLCTIKDWNLKDVNEYEQKASGVF